MIGAALCAVALWPACLLLVLAFDATHGPRWLVLRATGWALLSGGALAIVLGAIFQ